MGRDSSASEVDHVADCGRQRPRAAWAWTGFAWIACVAILPFHAWVWLTAMAMALQEAGVGALVAIGDALGAHVLVATLLATVFGQALLLCDARGPRATSGPSTRRLVARVALGLAMLASVPLAYAVRARIESRWPRISRAVEESYRLLAAEGSAGAVACSDEEASAPCPLRLVEAVERVGCGDRAIDVTLDDRSTEPTTNVWLEWCARGDELRLGARARRVSTDPRGQDRP